MGYVLGSFWGKYKLFLCRHKSSNRALPTYQTSPEPTKSRKKTKSIYFYIEASFPSSLPVYVWSLNLAFSLTAPNTAASGHRKHCIHCRLFASYVNPDISKDLHFSLPKIIRCNGIVHFLLFYISSRRTKQSTAIHTYIQYVLHVSISPRNWSVVLSHSDVLTFLQI